MMINTNNSTRKTFLVLMVVASSIAQKVNAGDIDWSTAAVAPLSETKIGAYGLKYAPTPEMLYNIDFIFNDETLNFEPDLSTLVIVEEAPYAAADIVRGGLLYDKWWKVNAESEPAETYADYPESGGQTGSTTWRCKECHGWDYKGNEGAYENGSHYTGIDGIYRVRKMPVAKIYNIVAAKNFPLSEQDIWDLVKFLKEGMIEMNKYIIFSGAQQKSVTGDAENGRTLYEGSTARCSNCHGTDGNGVPSVSVGAVANENPWEVLHKIRFGYPGTQMPSMINNGLSHQEQVDILTYAQTLE